MRNDHRAGRPEPNCRVTVNVPIGLLGVALAEAAISAVACLVALLGARTSNIRLIDGAVVAALAASWLNLLTLAIAADRKRKLLRRADSVRKCRGRESRGLLALLRGVYPLKCRVNPSFGPIAAGI
jgi:hypothetical protein